MNTTSAPIFTIRHEFEEVEFIEHDGTYFKGCRRCGGTGHYSFNGYDSDCYLCGNTAAKLGDVLGTLEQAQKWAHGVALGRAAADRRRRAKAEAIQAKLAAKREALKAVDAELHDFLMAIELGNGDQYETEEEYYAAEQAGLIRKRDSDSFLCSMKEQLVYGIYADKPFTERMVAASRRTMERRQAQAAERAALPPAPEGRVVVAGEIVGTKVVESDYGTSYKIIVKADEGWSVYCTIPTSLLGERELSEYKGRRITFTATLKRSDKDPAFAFGSRPTKGAWI